MALSNQIDFPAFFSLCEVIYQNFTLYFWSNLLTFNGQRIVGLCKSLTVNAVNFYKVGNG
jgi:hypothetical protein